jgi:hypothetical protein
LLHLLRSPNSIEGIAETGTAYKAIRRSFFNGLRQFFYEAFTGRPVDRIMKIGARLVDRYYRNRHLPMMAAMIRGDDPEAGDGKDWLGRPEFIYFLAVVVPCWLEYRTTPWKLYRQAEAGNTKALERLLRVDPHVGQEKRLGQVLFRLCQQNPKQLARLHRAGSEGRKTTITLADVKYALGGLLMKVSDEMQQIQHGELWIQVVQERTAMNKQDLLGPWIKQIRQNASHIPANCRLKAPDIAELFHAVARDAGGGRLNDRDFVRQPNSIYKRLARNAASWPSLWKADKKRAA